MSREFSSDVSREFSSDMSREEVMIKMYKSQMDMERRIYVLSREVSALSRRLATYGPLLERLSDEHAMIPEHVLGDLLTEAKQRRDSD